VSSKSKKRYSGTLPVSFFALAAKNYPTVIHNCINFIMYLMQIPLFEYIFEIPPKYNALKLHVIVNHIDPQTTMYLGHHPKRFYQLLILVDIFIFEIVRLQE